MTKLSERDENFKIKSPEIKKRKNNKSINKKPFCSGESVEKCVKFPFASYICRHRTREFVSEWNIQNFKMKSSVRMWSEYHRRRLISSLFFLYEKLDFFPQFCVPIFFLLSLGFVCSCASTKKQKRTLAHVTFFSECFFIYLALLQFFFWRVFVCASANERRQPKISNSTKEKHSVNGEVNKVGEKTNKPQFSDKARNSKVENQIHNFVLREHLI